MKDIMVDLETLGGSPNGVIAQIGACYFDILTGEIGECLSIKVDPISCQRAGFSIDADTVLWWLNQSPVAINAVFGEDTKPIHIFEALTKFNEFASKARDVWSHSTFDFVILMQYFKTLNIKSKVSYKAARDIRTLVSLANIPKTESPRIGVHHNALDDCKFQVQYCHECYMAIINNKK
jgi:hypothetical protein